MPFPPNSKEGSPSSPVAAILLKLKHGDKGGPDAGPGGGDDLTMAAQEFINAVKSGDASAVANIFRSMTDIAQAPVEPDSDEVDGKEPPGPEEPVPPSFPGRE